MCGIVGFISHTNSYQPDVIVAQMSAKISNRGPDDSGLWVDKTAGIALAHQRLSILDLSAAGHQPMSSVCGRYKIVFNGEIYNHLLLRDDLNGSMWRGHSDTETLLACFSAWGIEATLKRIVGMFAIALWDCELGMLTLARDRMGEKPLYYGWQGETFLFGSELKALKAHPSFNAEVNRNALAQFLRYGYVPSPSSIYRGILKLPPGSWLSLKSDCLPSHPVTPFFYWKAPNGMSESTLQYDSDIIAIDSLEGLLHQAIDGQMISDVPLGAFLSGGIDSSMVVALMQSRSSAPIKTFTIGFNERAYNEADHARAIASYLGTDHTEFYVTSEQAQLVIPSLPRLYDEPFADSSQIPTFLVSQLASKHVKVSLSGDGGDELFGGYSRYLWASKIWRSFGWAPKSVRAAVAGALTSLPPEDWNSIFSRLHALIPAKWRYSNAGDKLHKLASVLAVQTPEEIYLALVSHWQDPISVVKGAHEPITVIGEISQRNSFPDFENRMMYMDQLTYLPDDILVKVDRAAMGVGLETRVPFLDHRIVEFANTLPLPMKIREGSGKWILRQVLYRHIPKELIERPKMGFGVPIDIWLRGPLRDWAEDLLSEKRLREGNFFHSDPIRRKWAEHLSGRRNWASCLWTILMFQAWSEEQC